ncbi:MAG: BON domain-containing protein [Anaerolineae bacterium]
MAAMVGLMKHVDRELCTAVEEALRRYDPLRHSGSPITVISHDGTVELTGVVPSQAIKLVAADLARRVPGVREVRNHLISDTEIEIQAAQALAQDDRTRLASNPILVRSMLGVLYLRGTVASPEAKAAVTEIVRGIEGVREVVNQIEILGETSA